MKLFLALFVAAQGHQFDHIDIEVTERVLHFTEEGNVLNVRIEGGHPIIDRFYSWPMELPENVDMEAAKSFLRDNIPELNRMGPHSSVRHPEIIALAATIEYRELSGETGRHWHYCGPFVGRIQVFMAPSESKSLCAHYHRLKQRLIAASAQAITA